MPIIYVITIAGETSEKTKVIVSRAKSHPTPYEEEAATALDVFLSGENSDFRVPIETPRSN